MDLTSDQPTSTVRRRVGIAVAVVLGLILLVLAVGGVRLGLQVVEVRDSLQRAREMIADLRAEAVDDPQTLPPRVEEVRQATDSARSASGGPVWGVAEALPVVGANLIAIRELSTAIDDLADDGLVPLASAATMLTPEALRPVDGRIDLGPIAAAGGAVEQVDDAVQRARDAVAGVSTAGAVEQVAAAHDELTAMLDEAAGLTSGARSVTRIAPTMLGSDGPRNYLLMIQNNAESRSLGGNPAALVLVTVDQGAISLSDSASSLDFPLDPSLTPDPSVYAPYFPHAPSYIMDTTTRPDFPTAALLAKSFWERYRGTPIDGVLSFDPVALGYLLTATGPITLPTGDKLTSDNAASFLMSTVYARYSDPIAQDAFFAASAATIFDALRNGRFEPAPFLAAVGRAAEEHRFLLWSARPDEQEVISTTAVSGTLPDSNADASVVGVFIMDRSVSKMSFYLDSAAEVTARRCGVDGPEFDVTTTITSAIDQATADALPSYVAAGFLPRGLFTTDVYVLGPVGTTAVVDDPTGQITTGEDLGRPVVGFSATLGPLQTQQFAVTFRGTSGGDYGPLEAWVTPMVRPTNVTQSDVGC